MRSVALRCHSITFLPYLLILNILVSQDVIFEKLGLPTDVRDARGWSFQSQWQMSTDFSGVTIRPGTFD
jgi:hypothetical protein